MEIPMTLEQFCVWLITGGGAGILAYWLLERMNLTYPPEYRRYVAFLFAGLLGMLGFFLEVGMGYVPVPSGGRSWVELLFQSFIAAGSSIISSQVAHANRSLRGHSE